MAKDLDKRIEEEEEDEDFQVYTLFDENGKGEDFLHLGTMEYKGTKYCFFTPAEEDEESDENPVYIFTFGKDDKGDDVLLPFEDEDMYDEVYDVFKKKFDESQED